MKNKIKQIPPCIELFVIGEMEYAKFYRMDRSHFYLSTIEKWLNMFLVL